MNHHDNFDDLDDEDLGDHDEPVYDGPSRSQRKRDAESLQKLGEELISLKAGELEQFDLPDNLLKALSDARQIKSHGALRRQHQYIGKIMRNLDADSIATRLAALRHKHEINSAHFKQLEHWRDRILAEGDSAIDALLDAFPQADRQQLRQLQRNARKEQQAGKPPAAARQLFKYLRQLAEAG